MPIAEVNGIRLNYQEYGDGEPVVLVSGTGSGGGVWRAHQVPALVAAGYRVITVDNRGIAPSDGGAECAGGFTIDDLAGDIAGLIRLVGGPARVVGTSMGARVVQELALAHPDVVRKAVLMAAHGRPEPVMVAMATGECALYDQGIVLPPDYYAAVTGRLNLSPRTLDDPVAARDWLDLLAFSGAAVTAGVRAQLALEVDDFPDRLTAYRAISVPTLVIAFADDAMVRPRISREVAEAIPGARYVEIEGCGHFGYLERPDAVNEQLLAFLAG